MYALGVTTLFQQTTPGGLPRPPYDSQTGLTEAEEVAAVCRYQPCGSKLCPCAPATPTGTVPGAVQQLPTLVANAVKGVPSWVWVLGAVAAFALLKGGGRTRSW